MYFVSCLLQLRLPCGLETGRQTASHELSRRVAWEDLEVEEAATQLFGLGHLAVDKLENLFENFGAVGNGDRGLKVDVAHGHFSLLNGVPSTANTSFCNKRVRVQDIFQLGRRDLVALVLDEVLFAVGQPDIALIVDAPDIAGAEPAIVEGKDLDVGRWVLLVATACVSRCSHNFFFVICTHIKTVGAENIISPVVPSGTSLRSSSTMRICMPAMGLPTLPCLRFAEKERSDVAEPSVILACQ